MRLILLLERKGSHIEFREVVLGLVSLVFAIERDLNVLVIFLNLHL